MHLDILSQEQKELLPLISQFKREFYLVGGTAIALQIGHRRSIDFDLFKKTVFVSSKVLQKVETTKFPYIVTRKVREQLNLIINSVKITFFQYPYEIDAKLDLERVIKMPDLISLGAMKAFALGRRSKWKDYVDLYFLLKNNYNLKEITNKSVAIYGQEFSEKLFRAQLAYHKDIDYSEEVEFLPGFAVDEKEIKAFLIDAALGGFD
ncbi:MAG: nucleotidyl transferase AbiEii/AbiGii toxin family protein [Candidatus Azobacteroides sp.]|nr:nucleotidyl transferase AbiEii/AbiGii toxin family protein [Candidatus Azobacteroides sp.]